MKMTYSSCILQELEIHWRLHLGKILAFYRKEEPRGKKRGYVKKHDKLVNLYWKSNGMWKKESRG